MARKRDGKKKAKIRTDFKKKHEGRTRRIDLTRDYIGQPFDDDENISSERLSGKGALTRRRTVIGEEVADPDGGRSIQLEVDESICQVGRVLSVHGLTSMVQAESGNIVRCVTRGLLKSLHTDQRQVVAAGDRVLFRPEGDEEGFIERIEPRRGILSRTTRNRRHVIVTNVDQLLIIATAAEPALKPNLIDRYLVTAEKAKIRPVICINKIDLVDLADLQPLAGVYGQMGYEVHFVSAINGFGMERLKSVFRGRETAVAGQSGVGKSSILNYVQPGLELRIAAVSTDNQKGRHTTTAAQLIPLEMGGFAVDTPGIRQFQLWDVIPTEVAGFFRDVRPYVSLCRFPNCTHTHESNCAVKDAVADGQLDARRFESFCQICAGDDL